MKRFVSLAMVLTVAVSTWAQDKPATPPEKKDAPAEKKDAPQEKKDAAPAKDDKSAKPEAGKDDAKAREILKKADEATKKTMSVKYDFKYYATGGLEKMAGKGSGTAVLSDKVKSVTEFFAKVRFEIKMSAPNATEETEVTITSNGDKYAVMIPKTKKVYEDVDPSVLGRYGWPRGAAGNAGMREYSHPEPFSDEIKADKAELRGETNVGDEKCYEIHIVYAGGQGEAVWYFSTKDYLPRRVDRVNPAGPANPGSTVLELHKLVVAPTFATDPFTMVVPEGFTKTDEPAP